MVETPFDPIHVPSVMLSSEELNEIADQIEAGKLPPDYIKKYHAALVTNVYGEGYRVGAKGKPIEQGLGSASNMTRQSIDAYKKWGREEADFEKHVARMEKEFAACEEHRKSEHNKGDDSRWRKYL